MKILVFDDNETQRDAAKRQLGHEHELVLASTYDEARMLVMTQEFEVILTDLLVPPSAFEQRSFERFRGEKMPVGIFIALLGATMGGARFVGVLTDENHHRHPASAALDFFVMEDRENRDRIPAIFQVGTARFAMVNNPMFLESWETRLKNWKMLLDYLVGDRPEEVLSRAS